MSVPKTTTNDTEKTKCQTDNDNDIPWFGKLDWSLWADSAWAVLGMVAASFFWTPIFDFVGCRGKKISIYIGGAFLAGTMCMFIYQSIRRHRRGTTSSQLEQQDQEYKQLLKDKIRLLEAELTRMKGRRLSAQQSSEITEAIKQHGGQKFRIVAFHSDPEATSYGTDFLAALTKAGWDHGNFGVGQYQFSPEFRNIAIATNAADYPSRVGPTSHQALENVLHRLGLYDRNIVFLPEVPAGEIWILVGPHRNDGAA